MSDPAAQIDAYIRRETLVSMIINVLLSALFYALVFGRSDPVALWGFGQWVFDCAPQGFMIALMSTLVPGLLAARKLRAGTLSRTGRTSRLPRSLVPRALLLAMASAGWGVIIVFAIAQVTGLTILPVLTAFLLKLAYGAALAAIVTPLGLHAALASKPFSAGKFK